jgi:hypothetical protein
MTQKNTNLSCQLQARMSFLLYFDSTKLFAPNKQIEFFIFSTTSLSFQTNLSWLATPSSSEKVDSSDFYGLIPKYFFQQHELFGMQERIYSNRLQD